MRRLRELARDHRMAPAAAAIAAVLVAAGCGGGGAPKGPADATPPEVSFDVHVIKPDGSRAGRYTSGQTSGPIAIDAIDTLQIVAQAKDAESGARSVTVNAAIQVKCNLPKGEVTELPAVNKTIAQLVRADKAALVMATQAGPATELFGLKCDPPATSGSATIKLTGEGESLTGAKGSATPVDVVASLNP